jgi:hypothetical protein
MFEILDTVEPRRNRTIITATCCGSGLACAALAVWALV